MSPTPIIVSREQANLQKPIGPYTRWESGEPSGKTGHWEGSGGHTDHALCAAEWRSIQLFHLHTGYVDIAYHWGICQHGVVFTGRPITVQSAAQRGGNKTHVAIVYMGGPLTPFTFAAKVAYAWLLRRYHGPDLSHKDEPTCNTTCAGSEITFFIHHPISWPDAGIPPAPRPVPAPRPKPLPPGGVHHPVLANRSNGPAVLELQRRLNAVTGSHLVLDGKFGPKTEMVVRQFQRYFNLGIDGIAGPKTWGLLDYFAALKHVL